MIHLNNTIKEAIDDEHFRTRYFCTCDKCGADRGYLSKQGAMKPFCKKCCVRVTEESRKKMSLAKVGKTPWNKGLKENRSEVIDKISKAKRGKSPPNKNKKLSFEDKIKLSCAARGISLSEFDELKTSISRLERNKFADMNLHVKCFERFNYTCDYCKLNKTLLHAHHMNSWKYFPDQRFELDNLVALCKTCHDKFHTIYGNGKSSPNTKEQYTEFKSNHAINSIRKKIMLVVGVSGAGKSWVCSQLNNIRYIQYDKTNKLHIRSMMFNDRAPIILYDPTTHISSFIKRNSDVFDIELVVIQETEMVIRSRLVQRGGMFTASVKARMKRMKNLAKTAVFTGTSSEVLAYLSKRLTYYCRSSSPE